MPQFHAAHPAARHLTPQTALVGIYISLHPVAKRFFRDSRLMATIPSDRSDVRGRYLAGLSFGKEGAIPEEASSDAEPRPNYREIPPDRG